MMVDLAELIISIIIMIPIVLIFYVLFSVVRGNRFRSNYELSEVQKEMIKNRKNITQYEKDYANEIKNKFGYTCACKIKVTVGKKGIRIELDHYKRLTIDELKELCDFTNCELIRYDGTKIELYNKI